MQIYTVHIIIASTLCDVRLPMSLVFSIKALKVFTSKMCRKFKTLIFLRTYSVQLKIQSQRLSKSIDLEFFQPHLFCKVKVYLNLSKAIIVFFWTNFLLCLLLLIGTITVLFNMKFLHVNFYGRLHCLFFQFYEVFVFHFPRNLFTRQSILQAKNVF